MSIITKQQQELRRALGLDETIAPLRRLRPARRALEAAFLALLTTGGILLLPAGGLPLALGVLLLAVVYNALMLWVHEAVHALFGPRTSRTIGFLSGAPLLISVSAFKVLHMRHHRNLGGPGDPDHYGNYNMPSWALHWMRLLIGFFVYLFAIPLLAMVHGTNGDRRRIAAELACLVAIHVAAWLTIPSFWMVWAWLVPVIIAGYMTAIRGFAQHTLTEAGHPVANTRTMRVPRPVSWALLGENHHTEHHLWPDVPSYHLARVHALVWHALPRRVSNRSYLALVGRFIGRTIRRDARPMGLEEPCT